MCSIILSLLFLYWKRSLEFHQYLSIYKIIFSFIYFKIIFTFTCTYLYVCVGIRESWCGYTCLGAYMEVIGQFEVVSFFFFSCVSQELNSDHEVWWEVLLPTSSSHRPSCTFRRPPNI